jgi:hypothetical protein
MTPSQLEDFVSSIEKRSHALYFDFCDQQLTKDKVSDYIDMLRKAVDIIRTLAMPPEEFELQAFELAIEESGNCDACPPSCEDHRKPLEFAFAARLFRLGIND